MVHGTNFECQHRDSRGHLYDNCPLPECIDGVLCCEAHLLKDRKPAVTYDAAFGGRLCRECADDAIAATKCWVCPETEGTEEVTLLNQSKLRLCRRCARLHADLVLERLDADLEKRLDADLADAAAMAGERGAA